MFTAKTKEAFPFLGHPQLARAGWWMLLGLATLGLGWLIVRGRGPLAAGAFIFAILYLSILARWQRGIYGLLIYLPFSGVVTLALYPWKGLPALNPILYKDWLFVLPAYAGFLGWIVLRRERPPRVGPLTGGLFLAFALLVVAQMANPGVPNALVALIGAKVWLLYLPLYVLTLALIASRRHLVFLMRLLVGGAAVPCAVGIAEFVSAQFLGYQAVMDAIYGAVGAEATQGFTRFEVGEGFIARIPSTFTFVAQYFSFTLAMLAPCYALWRVDPSFRWRRLAYGVLTLAGVAAFLSGARAAFVCVPLLLGMMYALDRGFPGLLRACLYAGGVLVAALAVSRVAVTPLFEYVSELFRNYVPETIRAVVQTVANSPLGNGTGTNTGPARYALERPELFTAIENYHAKIAHELGIPGLLLLWTLLGVFIGQGLRARRRLADPALRAVAAAFTSFIIILVIYSLKGWFIDLDPLNVYFWMFAAVLAKLPALDSGPGGLSPAPAEERS